MRRSLSGLTRIGALLTAWVELLRRAARGVAVMVRMTSSVLPSRTSTAFYAQAAISFGLSMVALGVGIAYLPVDRWVRAFLSVGALYAINSSFTLAKCVRDQQEASTVRVRVDEARMEKLIADHDPFKVVAG